MNDNQNIFVREGRTTSRVTHRPGGECSISLGGYTHEELERMRQLREAESNEKATTTTNGTCVAKENASNMEPSKGSVDTVEKIDNNMKEEKADKDEKTEAEPNPSVQPIGTTNSKKGVSSNAFASSSTTNSFNVLTDRPTSRVSHPPGGHSSFVLG